MNPDETAKLAHTLAETARVEEERRNAAVRAKEVAAAAAAEAAMSYPVRGMPATDPTTPLFLHERELAAALRVVTLFASGRNPFEDEPMERLRSEQRTEILRALSVVVCTIFGGPKPIAIPQVDTPVIPSDPTSERPLQQYLDRVERQAILNAIAEAQNNHTEAARLLGITYRSLRYRIERLEIELP